MYFFMYFCKLFMNYEVFIAQRLKLGGGVGRGSLSLNIALAGITLAIVVMILSITVMMGFRNEISNKIYCLDPHIKVSNAVLGIDDKYATISALDAFQAIENDSVYKGKILSMTLIADKPAILKTDEDFKGIQYRGVDNDFDWSYLRSHLVGGRTPQIGDSAGINEIVISRIIAQQLRLKVGDKVLTYFIDDKVKVRNSRVVGIFNTDLDAFDKSLILGDIRLIQQVNGWDKFTGNFIGIYLKDVSNVKNDAYQLYSLLAADTYNRQTSTLFNVTQTHDYNLAFFSWLNMLDTNVVIILVLMLIVTAFTLVSALLMIVLERIRMVGLLKALGATDGSIRRIFIFLTGKLILQAIVLGNIIGLGLALIQKYLHLVKLDPEAYYMPFVPIHIDWMAILMLNIGILVISYLTLIGPSYIISSIKPSSSMRFE